MTKTAAPRTLLNPIENMLGYQLRRASLVTMSALSDAFEAVGLRMTEAMILRLVEANPGCNQAEIGRTLGVKRTNMVPIIGGLVDRGLISRAAADGRTHALYITEEGAALRAKIAKLALEDEAHFFGQFDEPTKAILLQAFRAIRAKAAP
jgi:DNA-binding MarR family transcriptional regulator